MTHDPDAERWWDVQTRLARVEDQQNECRACGALYSSPAAAQACQTEDEKD